MGALAIPVIAKALWANRYLVLCIALVGAFWWWSAHERHVGETAIKAAVEKATETEHQRRLEAEAYVQQWAAGAINHVNDLEGQNAALRKRAATLSVANAGKACFDPDTVTRLNGVRH